MVCFFAQDTIFSRIMINRHPYVKTSSMRCSFTIALRIIYFLNFIYFRGLWSYESEHITEIESILHLHSHSSTQFIIFANNSDKIFFFELCIFIVVDSICTWIANEKSWSITSIGYSKEFSRECLAVVW